MNYSVGKGNPVAWKASALKEDGSRHSGQLFTGRAPGKHRRESAGKKIEQDTSRGCLKSEYLTLLNSFRVLQPFDCKAFGPAHGGLVSYHPPKLFNEKELYGR